MNTIVRALAAGMLAAAGAVNAVAADTSARGAAPYCRAIAAAVDAAAPGAGPAFVVSYRPGPDEASLPDALKTSAFAYDDALAAIALVSCADVPRATRIADAFLAATERDRTFNDGRIRNAYRAGAVEEGAVKLPGWWDAAARRWDEDAYQDSTSTGNAAWVALALLTVHQATGRPDYLTAASRLLDWIETHAADGPGPAGYAGGVSGFDGAQQALRWKSTEHNIDVAAAAGWAYRLTHDPGHAAMAGRATAFVTSRFLADGGYFLLGTKPDGSDAARTQLALDVQVWPSLGIAAPPAEWHRALAFADAHMRRGDGMTFAGTGLDRWTEGTGQAALAFRMAGMDAAADALLAGLPAHASPSGLLYATSGGAVPTGLQVEAQGGGEFQYFRRPHLGATAWAALAAGRWNPFTGRRLG